VTVHVPLRLCADPESGPSERCGHSPFEWGRRVCCFFSSTLGVARCGRSAGCVRCRPCWLLCGGGYPVGVSVSSSSGSPPPLLIRRCSCGVVTSCTPARVMCAPTRASTPTSTRRPTSTSDRAGAPTSAALCEGVKGQPEICVVCIGSESAARPAHARMHACVCCKGFDLTWCRALTWYFPRLSPPRSHFKPWKAVGTRGRGSLAARLPEAGRPAQQTVVLAKSTKLKHGTKFGRTLCYVCLYVYVRICIYVSCV